MGWLKVAGTVTLGGIIAGKVWVIYWDVSGQQIQSGSAQDIELHNKIEMWRLGNVVPEFSVAATYLRCAVAHHWISASPLVEHVLP